MSLDVRLAAKVRRLPGLVREVELSEALPGIAAHTPDGRRVQRVWLLVRLYTEPIGALLLDVPEAGVGPVALSVAIDDELGEAVRSRLIDDGPPPYLARRAEVLLTAPHVTVVICTTERPQPLARCLESLLKQRYPRFRVLVVDNAPATGATAEVVARAAAHGPVDYLVEPNPGQSHARNRAVAAAPGEILAWIDDDEVADPYWLSEIARALADHPEADVVAGVITPAELETDAQLWFEQSSGPGTGRGFAAEVFSAATALPPFGTGANMAFRPGVIERIGGFHPVLGAGTPATGAEDTLALIQVLLSGGTIVHQPSALVRHYHPR